jgi:putative FmdB family regulatory protein
MPTYGYDCPRCGGFEALRSLAQRNEPAACPQCGTVAPRVLAATMPRLALLEAATRRAYETNERAAHEPRASGSYARLRHPAGCGCCLTAKRGATQRAPNGNKAFPSKRPWMISH